MSRVRGKVFFVEGLTGPVRTCTLSSMTDFWSFVVAFFSTLVWGVFTILLNILAVLGVILAIVYGGPEVSQRFHWGWNFLYVPVVVVAAFFVIMFLIWSAMDTGVY